MGNEQQRVDVLARALFEAYSRNGGNPPDAHYDRNAAELWMAQALAECGVAELIEAGRSFLENDTYEAEERFIAALANVGAQS